MIKSILQDKKNLGQFIFFSLLATLIYFVIDYLNMSYQEMMNSYGIYLVLLNILLNIVMGIMTGFLLATSNLMISNKQINKAGSSISFLSMLFGMLTYGCTPCVVTFFANIGIAFAVVALPLAGLPYKLMSLLLLTIGILIALRQIKRGSCKVKY